MISLFVGASIINLYSVCKKTNEPSRAIKRHCNLLVPVVTPENKTEKNDENENFIGIRIKIFVFLYSLTLSYISKGRVVSLVDLLDEQI